MGKTANANDFPAAEGGRSGLELSSLLYGTDPHGAFRRRFDSLALGMSPEAGFPAEFAAGDENIRFFSSPGRTELCGNHTDHNRGMVLAASVHLDMAASVVPRGDRRIFLRSAGFEDTLVNLADGDEIPGLSPRPDEAGTTAALVRGIAACFAARGADVGGFSANVVSDVPQGSGLSSSAALEVLVARIFDSLYCPGRFPPIELAKIGREAENVFFGKPCGLMDQAACSVGGAVSIDFADPAEPAVGKIAFDPLSWGLALCVVDSGGSHANLTPEYAAIPREMGDVARFFGKNFLSEVGLSQLMSSIGELRQAAGDRAVLRAIHFFNENRRVAQMSALLTEAGSDSAETTADRFLDLVNESGASSWELLQNMYAAANPREQGLSLALAASREFFREEGLKAACRVHGGGFAGTVQAYVPLAALDGYRSRMEALFGVGSLTVLRVRPVGAVELTF